MCVWLPAVSPRLSNVRCRGIGLVGYSGSPPGTRAAARASPIGRSNQEISGGAKRRGGSQVEEFPLIQLPPLAGSASRSRCPPILGGQLVPSHFKPDQYRSLLCDVRCICFDNPMTKSTKVKSSWIIH